MRFLLCYPEWKLAKSSGHWFLIIKFIYLWLQILLGLDCFPCWYFFKWVNSFLWMWTSFTNFSISILENLRWVIFHKRLYLLNSLLSLLDRGRGFDDFLKTPSATWPHSVLVPCNKNGAETWKAKVMDTEKNKQPIKRTKRTIKKEWETGNHIVPPMRKENVSIRKSNQQLTSLGKNSDILPFLEDNFNGTLQRFWRREL